MATREQLREMITRAPIPSLRDQDDRRSGLYCEASRERIMRPPRESTDGLR